MRHETIHCQGASRVSTIAVAEYLQIDILVEHARRLTPPVVAFLRGI